MSEVWSCNEWDPLEEVIVGNPLGARYPTQNRSTHLAEFPDRPLGEIPKWIDMNLFSINPGLAVVDKDQTGLIKRLEKHGIDVIPYKLRHSKMLGGGLHCKTLDIRRPGAFQQYFE